MNPHKFVNCRSNNNALSSSQQNPLAYSLPRRIKSLIDEKDRTPKFSPTTFISTSHNFSKITEKDCTDLQSLVKKSVDDINDLLSLKQLQSSFNDHIDSSRRKNQSVSLSKDVKRNLNDELNLKESISKESKSNFTFNINNFILIFLIFSFKHFWISISTNHSHSFCVFGTLHPFNNSIIRCS